MRTGRFIIIIVLAIISGELSGQWLQGYSYREKISINGDNVFGLVDLVDFPLLVYLSDPDLRSVNYGGLIINNNGWDIRFTSDDGTTLLDHEIELYDATNGGLTAWVRIPNLTHAEDTKLYMYFGNQSVIVDPSTSDAWNSDFRGVWHLNENTNDASQYANDGVNNGTTSAIGKIGNARSFDGTDDYIRLTAEDLYDNLSQGTVLAWVKWTGADFETIFGADSGPCEHPFEFAIESGSYKIWAANSGCSGTFIGQSSLLNPTEWHQLAYVVNGTGNNLYIDGEKQLPTYGAGSASSTFFFDESSEEATIYELGRSVQNNEEAFSGLIDEVRISSTPFSSDWIRTSYENQNDPENFYETSGIEISNDLPCDALTLDLNGDCSSQIFSNFEASGSGVPLTECVGYSGGDTWFKVEVPVSGNLIVKVESATSPGWLRQPGLAVYSGTCDNLVHDTCWIDPLFPAPILTPEFTFSAYTPGETLFLRVWGYNGSIGNFKICASDAVDSEDPTISCPENINVPADPGECSAAVSIAIPVTDDNEGVASVVNKYNGTMDASDGYPVGTTLVEWIVTDLFGNTASCFQSITITDNEAPDISCLSDRSVFLDASCDFTIPDFTDSVTVNDNCDPAPILSQTPLAGTIISGAGSVHQIILNASDTSNNISQCQFEITVLDTISPSASNPAPILVQSEGDVPAPDITVVADETDNCTASPLVTFVSDVPEGSCPIIITRTYRITDISGNSIDLIQTITVVDHTDPEIICPGTITETLDENCEFILPDYTSSASFNDSCDTAPVLTQAPPVGTVLSGSGSIQEIVLTARDEAGNESACAFNITLLDNTPPEASSIKDTTVILQAGIFKASIDMPLPVFTDNCGVQSVSNDFNGGREASGIYRYGTTIVVYTVSDFNNNVATFDQKVVVGLEPEPDYGLVIPEAFSPNEDGLNDRFEILGLDQYPENELQVYNVFGKEVFHMENYNNSWDGTSSGRLNNGNKLPTGTYYYVLNLVREEALVTGFVYIRRE